jgi:hypothetical protein
MASAAKNVPARIVCENEDNVWPIRRMRLSDRREATEADDDCGKSMK